MPETVAIFLATAALQAGATAAVGSAIYTVASIGTTLAISAGLSYAGGLLAPKPEGASPSDIKTNIREQTSPRFRHYGYVRAGGVTNFIEASIDGDQNLYKLLVTGTDRVDSIVGFYIDDEAATIDGLGQVEEWKDRGGSQDDRIVLKTRLGLATETAFSELIAAFPTYWTSSHRGDGMSSVLMIMNPPGPQSVSKAFPAGVNTAVSVVYRSSIVWDPRLGAIDNPAAHAFSENLALCVLDHLISEWGMRLGSSWIVNAIDHWIVAANVCDEAVALKAGGVEARWRVALSYNMAERPVDVLQRMLDAGDAMLFPTANQGIALKVGRWETPTVLLDDDAIVSFQGLTRGGDVQTRATVVRARYTSRPHKYAEQDADQFIDEDAASLYGEDGPDLALFASPSHPQTRRLQKIALRRLNPNWRGTISTNLRGLEVLGERVISVNMSFDDGSRLIADFEIQGQPAFLMAEGSVITGLQMEVRSMSSEASAWNPALEEGTAPVVPEDIEKPERTIPVPTGFVMSQVTRIVAGQSLSFIHFIANAADLGGDRIVFEVSTDGGTTYAEVPKERTAVEAEYGPMQDDLTYIGRAVTVSAGDRRGTPTATQTLVSASSVPLTPEAFTATLSGLTVSYSARGAKNDKATQALQFRRGTTAQAALAAAVIDDQLGNAGDVRSGSEGPGYGVFRYWCFAKNASGVLSAAAAGPTDITIYGADATTNGGFATDTVWTKPTGGTIASGVFIKAAGTAGNLFEALTITPQAGETWRVTYTILSRTGGTVNSRIGGTPGTSGPSRSANGTYSDDLVMTGTPNANLIFVFDSAAAMSLDNVSAIRVG